MSDDNNKADDITKEKKPKEEKPDDFSGMIIEEEPPETFEPVIFKPSSTGDGSVTEEPPESFGIDPATVAPPKAPSSPYPPELAGMSPAGPPTMTNPTDPDDVPSMDVPKAVYQPDINLGKVAPWAVVKLPDSLLDLELTEEMYPKTGYLPGYLQWAMPTTDAPRAFHLIAGLSMLSSVLGPCWQVDYAGGKKLNFYALLIGQSGDRKSSAMRCAFRVRPDEFPYCASSLASSAAFVTHLRDNPRSFWYLDEADRLFQTFQSKTGSDLGACMVTAYDGEPTVYTSLTQGIVQALEPYITMVTVTAPEWLKERKLSINLLRGGLISRFWLVPAKRTEDILMPPRPNKKVEDVLRNRLAYLYDLSNKGFDFNVGFSPTAQKLFLQYMVGRGDPPHSDLGAVWNRAMDHIAKIALLYHISCGRKGRDSKIQEDSVHQAINLWHDYLLRGHFWAVKNLVATDDLVSEYEQDVLTRLDLTNGCMPLSELYAGRSFKSTEGLFNLYVRRRVRFWACRSVTSKGGRPRFYVTPGQKPTGFVQCEKKVPRFIQKRLAEQGVELEEVDMPYPSLDTPTTTTATPYSVAQENKMTLAELQGTPFKLLKKHGWIHDDYMDEEATIERWRFTEDGKDTFAYWDGEAFWVQSEWKTLKPGGIHTLESLMEALEGAGELPEDKPGASDPNVVPLFEEPPETWDVPAWDDGWAPDPEDK